MWPVIFVFTEIGFSPYWISKCKSENSLNVTEKRVQNFKISVFHSSSCIRHYFLVVFYSLNMSKLVLRTLFVRNTSSFYVFNTCGHTDKWFLDMSVNLHTCQLSQQCRFKLKVCKLVHVIRLKFTSVSEVSFDLYQISEFIVIYSFCTHINICKK